MKVLKVYVLLGRMLEYIYFERVVGIRQSLSRRMANGGGWNVGDCAYVNEWSLETLGYLKLIKEFDRGHFNACAQCLCS